jgi:hypothetical protein
MRWIDLEEDSRDYDRLFLEQFFKEGQTANKSERQNDAHGVKVRAMLLCHS